MLGVHPNMYTSNNDNLLWHLITGPDYRALLQGLITGPYYRASLQGLITGPHYRVLLQGLITGPNVHLLVILSLLYYKIIKYPIYFVLSPVGGRKFQNKTKVRARVRWGTKRYGHPV